MIHDRHGEKQGLEAPEVDQAAQAPEFYRQVSDGLQVRFRCFEKGPKLMIGRPKMVPNPSYSSLESLG